MKICHIITRLIVGGAQENTILTCEQLHRKGHEVSLLAGPETGPEGSLWDRARAGGYQVREIRHLVRNVHPSHDFACAKELARHIAELQPDIVHTHSSKAGIIGRLAAAKFDSVKTVHTIHGMSFNRTQPAPVRFVYRALEWWAAARTDALISVADAMTDQAVAACVAPPEKFRTIYSGLETDWYQPDSETRRRVRSEWGVSEDTIIVGTVARLFDNKGYEQLIEAMPSAVRSNAGLHFVWVGDGARKPQYMHRLGELELADRVTLTGLVPPRRVAELMCGFDMLVHVSRWEGLPRAVVQAQLTEVPVISGNNDGAPEVVQDGRTGLLLDVDDSAGLSQAITRLAGDANLRAAMGREGRAHCLDRFDHRRMADRIERLYEWLLDRPAEV